LSARNEYPGRRDLHKTATAALEGEVEVPEAPGQSAAPPRSEGSKRAAGCTAARPRKP